ncbi:MAG: SUMF1/EgtB/PvdO family nonheme iron enzyme [Chloroflexi bacterium]|nr:SUMF1/EgtB/PvdO family nonheme iron enzyme [Chloroflexota bacterium]
MELRYLDFDLLIERFGERYRARVIQSPAGQASSEFALPFSDIEIENLMLRVGRPRHTVVRKVESAEMHAAKAFGAKLFDAVFTGDVRAVLRSSLDAANREGKGLRLRLRLADTPELGDLPWEFLYNSNLNRFLTLSVKTPLVRYLELAETPRPLQIELPLRVLVMISSPTDYAPLNVEQEWHKLNNALRELQTSGLVKLERLEQASLGALRRTLRRGTYHVVHFVGHGGFDAQAQDGVLVLEDEQERGRRIGGQYLGAVLRDFDSLRLVILNACEGARTSRTDPFAGVAQSLAQQGIPAVIAMQFEVSDDAALTFGQEFYTALAEGSPVDAALAEARSAIFAQVNDLEWGTPVLYLRASDGVIFTLPTPEQLAQRARERMAQERRARERAAQVEQNYRAAESCFAQDDFDAATLALTALFALDPNHAAARELELKIQDARAEQARIAHDQAERARAEQARLAREKAERERSEKERLAREQVEQQRKLQIETLYRAAQKNFTDKNYPAALNALDQVLALDATHRAALELKSKTERALAARQAPSTEHSRTNWRIWGIRILVACLMTAFLIGVALYLFYLREPQLVTGGNGKDKAPMVFVPAGIFRMGSSDLDTDASDDEKKQHTVSLNTFWIDQHEVTNAQYRQCVDANGCQPPSMTSSSTRSTYYGNPQYDNYPVIYISWYAASRYCEWAGKRLPTEAEWEKAARGTDGRIYPWGNDFDANKLNSDDGGKRDITTVGSYPSGRSWSGALDMAGNVWEWVNDWYERAYYDNSPRDNPKGPATGQARVLRGGSWISQPVNTRAAFRHVRGSDESNYSSGFRCAQ